MSPFSFLQLVANKKIRESKHEKGCGGPLRAKPGPRVTSITEMRKLRPTTTRIWILPTTWVSILLGSLRRWHGPTDILTLEFCSLEPGENKFLLVEWERERERERECSLATTLLQPVRPWAESLVQYTWTAGLKLVRWQMGAVWSHWVCGNLLHMGKRKKCKTSH